MPTFLDAGGERIYFESWGDGDEAVVLCHGMGGSHAIWYQQVAHLVNRHRVVTWDQRGFGRSTCDSGDLGPRPAISDLTLLLDHLRIEHAHIIGQSMGGWVALGFAIDHPDRTISLVLADTTAGIFTPRIRQTLHDYGEEIAAAPPPDEWPMGTHPAVGEQLLEQNLAQSFLYSQLGSLTQPPPPGRIIPLLMATDHTADAQGLDLPTLFVVGEHDPIFPPELIESAAEFIDGSEVSVVENTGHSPYFESPQLWNDIVGSFLRHSGAMGRNGQRGS